MATLKDLAERFRRMPEQIERGASELAKDVALTILADVTVKTPVDTSKAASNWQTQINVPVDSEIDAHFPGKAGSTAQQSVDEAYRVGAAELENKKPGEKIYISNVTKYIKYLNDGSSSQQPRGFVERAVMVGKKKIKDSSVKVLKHVG